MTDLSEAGDGPAAMFHRGVLVLLVSVLAGVLLAGALFPLVGGIGLAARAGAESFTQLPDGLDEPKLPVRSRILAADGSLIATVYFNENRIVVPISAIPASMQQAIIAIEDQRFYRHHGVDFRGLSRALVRNQQEGEITQGGSTLTQQYVKNVLIESATDKEGQRKATERSTTRKLREARYALALEKRYDKREILEKYLNIAYFGQGVYGVGTAAQHYFSKPIQQITVAEAALLAGMVKNPTRYDPEVNPKTAKARRDLVLDQMLDQKFINAQQHKAATTSRIALRKQNLINDCGLTLAPFFCAWIRDSIVNDDRFTGAATKEERFARLFQGGLEIRTTLDPKMQRATQQAIASTLAPGDAARAAAVGVIVEPGTGHVRAMASNQTYGSDKAKGQSEVNHALGGSTGFQAGSTFKTFFLATAVKQGIPLRLALNSPGTYVSRKPGFLNGGRPYPVHNYDGSGYGVIDMPKATWNSVNTYYIQLAERTGLDEPIRLAKAMGITAFDIPKAGSTVLGSGEVSPLQMTEAYATLAARGVHCPAIGITAITASNSEELFRYDPAKACQRVLDVEDADTVNAVLQGVVTSGTGKAANIGRPSAGKTGTSSEYATAWYLGYTPQLAGGVYMGHPRAPVSNPLVRFKGKRVTGGSFPAQIWSRMMKPVHEGLPVLDFEDVPFGAFQGEGIPIPDVRGLSAAEAIEILNRAGFDARYDPRRVSAFPIAAGLVGTTSPGPGTAVPRGTTVLIFLSDGRAPQPTPTRTLPPRTLPPSPKPTEKPDCKGKDCKTPTPSPSAAPPPPSNEPTGNPPPNG